MKEIILLILIFGLFGCSNSDAEKISTIEEKAEPEIVSDSTAKSSSQVLKQEVVENESENLSDEELMIKWTWGDNLNVSKPISSYINNPTFNPELLIGKWMYPEDDKPILEFRKDSLNVFFERHIYTINSDSLRIYTNADHPGGGIDRGILKKLTKDSLLIEWSTDDMNLYLRFNN